MESDYVGKFKPQIKENITLVRWIEINEIPKLLVRDCFNESIRDETLTAISFPFKEQPSATVKSSLIEDFAFNIASANNEVNGEITIDEEPASSIDGSIIW